ncbi:hypothetical protein [Catenuloplanes indicus]|uniref:Uncharacterized protein n=1 Tax=Catenuloplanes indicus TaxID=137267 RepID=A0AAE4B414_9ACTN|nr:hypothetical protein [Catenuloplanes indicus]MDQ0370833.1 hypothetical protein [Catenuloplanes indicus]
MKIEALTWSSAGAWTARWAAGAVLGQIVFGPTTMLFLALVTGVAAGAGAMYLIHRRAVGPRAGRRVRSSPGRMSRTAGSGARRPFVPPARPAPAQPSPAPGPPSAASATRPVCTCGAASPRTPVAVVSARLAALAARSWRALRRPRATRPAPPGPPPARRYSPRAPKRSFSPLAPPGPKMS